MGLAIGDAARAAGAQVAGAIDREGTTLGPHANLAELAAASDVLVDFTAPSALGAHLAAAVAAETPLVIGTTGLTDADHRAIDEGAARVAILQTANTSLGVNLLSALVEDTARRLGPDWDIEIVEMHHRHKRDAPSGTALLLGAAANRGRGASDGTSHNRLDRLSTGAGAREEGGIYYASLRGGSVAGDHLVVFAGEGERIELGHRAEDRSIFARGAIKAALWLAGKPPGRYSMKDVLGL